jgi:hypothetical protein
MFKSDKHYILLLKIVNYTGKKFYTIGLRLKRCYLDCNTDLVFNAKKLKNLNRMERNQL